MARSRIGLVLVLSCALGLGAAEAATSVRTETIPVPPADVGEQPAGTPETGYGEDGLPEPVARMRRAIIDVALEGDIEALRVVMETNELPLLTNAEEGVDAIAHWREVAGDAEGREILALMVEMLEMGYARLDPGTDREIYVWPYHAAVPFAALTPRQQVELYTIITPQDREAMEEYGRYTFYRLGIGPDGTWHFFLTGE